MPDPKEEISPYLRGVPPAKGADPTATSIKDLPPGLTEYGKGVFVTAAMMKEIQKDTYFPGQVIHCKSSKEDPTLTDIMERLDRLERLIKHIFGDYVLIGGRFMKVTP